KVENNSADCKLDGNKLDGNNVEGKAPHFYFCSTKAQLRYDEVKYQEGDYLLFGKETRGLSEELLHENYDMTVRIPMVKDARSLNLSNSVAIVVYEAMRQINFENLLEKGHLTKY
ncbi:MAG: TrmH family RNA methyltransferase, partial [Clostridia bacterium]